MRQSPCRPTRLNLVVLDALHAPARARLCANCRGTGSATEEDAVIECPACGGAGRLLDAVRSTGPWLRRSPLEAR